MRSLLVYVAISLACVTLGIIIGSSSPWLRRNRILRAIRTGRSATWAGVIIALAALIFSNRYAAESSKYAAQSSNAVLKQVALESSPVLTQECDSQRTTGWTIVRSYAPNLPDDWTEGSVGNWVPKLVVGSSVFCTIHNYSRLPVIDLHFEFGYGPCVGFPNKTGAIIVPVIASGGESRILVANESENTGMSIVPLQSTKFVMPPGSDFLPYSYPRFQLVDYELGAAPIPSPAPGATAQPTPRPYNYCSVVNKPQTEHWKKYWQEKRRSFHVGDMVTSGMSAFFPIGSLSANGRCPNSTFTSGGIRRPIWALGRQFQVTHLSPDLTMASIRGPGGGIVCADTASLAHVH